MNEKINKILLKFKNPKRKDIIPLLQAVQNKFNYIPSEAINKIADATGTQSAEVYGIATFYTQFSFTPRGKTHVKICKGTACHVNGADFVIDSIKRNFDIKPGETTKDGSLSTEVVACLGCCGLAPVVMVGEDKTYGKLDPDKVIKVLKKEIK